MYVLLGRCTGIPRQSCMLQQNGVWGVLVASCLQDRNGEMKIRALVCPSLRKYYESDTLMLLT